MKLSRQQPTAIRTVRRMLGCAAIQFPSMPLVAIRRGVAAGSLRVSLGFTGNGFRLAFSPGHTIGRSEPSIQPTIFSMGYETRVEISRNNVRLESAIVGANAVDVAVQPGLG